MVLKARVTGLPTPCNASRSASRLRCAAHPGLAGVGVPGELHHSRGRQPKRLRGGACNPGTDARSFYAALAIFASPVVTGGPDQLLPVNRRQLAAWGMLELQKVVQDSADLAMCVFWAGSPKSAGAAKGLFSAEAAAASGEALGEAGAD